MFHLNVATPCNMQTAVGLAPVPMMMYSPATLAPMTSDLQNAAMAAAWFQSLPGPSPVMSLTTSYRDISNGSFGPLMVPLPGAISGHGSMPVCRSDVGFAAALQKLAHHQRQAVSESSLTAEKSASTSQKNFNTNYAERRLPRAAQSEFHIADCGLGGRHHEDYNDLQNLTQFDTKKEQPSDRSCQIMHTSPHPVLSSSSSSAAAVTSTRTNTTPSRCSKRRAGHRDNYAPAKTSPALSSPAVKRPRLSPFNPTSSSSKPASQIRPIPCADAWVSGISSIGEEGNSSRTKSAQVRFHRPFETEHPASNETDAETCRKSFSCGEDSSQSVNLDLPTALGCRPAFVAKPAEDDTVDGVRSLPYNQPSSWSDYLRLLAGVTQCEDGSNRNIGIDNVKSHRSNYSKQKCQVDIHENDSRLPVPSLESSQCGKATSEVQQSRPIFAHGDCKEISFSRCHISRPASTENQPSSSDDRDAEASSSTSLHFEHTSARSFGAVFSDQTIDSVHKMYTEVIGCDDVTSSVASPFRTVVGDQSSDATSFVCNKLQQKPTFTNWPGVDRLLEAYDVYRKEMKSEKQFLEKHAAKLQQRSRELTDSAEQLNTEHQELCCHVQFLRQCFQVDRRTLQSLTDILQSLGTHL